MIRGGGGQNLERWRGSGGVYLLKRLFSSWRGRLVGEAGYCYEQGKLLEPSFAERASERRLSLRSHTSLTEEW